jgi:hypothetical protein
MLHVGRGDISLKSGQSKRSIQSSDTLSGLISGGPALSYRDVPLFPRTGGSVSTETEVEIVHGN